MDLFENSTCSSFEKSGLVEWLSTPGRVESASVYTNIVLLLFPLLTRLVICDESFLALMCPIVCSLITCTAGI